MVGWQAMKMVNYGLKAGYGDGGWQAMEMVNYGRMAGYGDG